MKRIIGCFLAVALLWAGVVLAATKIRSAIIVNSTLDSSPVGATTPSTGVFTTLADTALTTNACVQSGSGGVLASIACPNFGSTTTTCTTSGSSYAGCPITVPLNFTEPDTNYKASCSGVGPSGFPYVEGITKGTSSITVEIRNGTSNGATPSSYSEMDCVVGGS